MELVCCFLHLPLLLDTTKPLLSGSAHSVLEASWQHHSQITLIDCSLDKWSPSCFQIFFLWKQFMIVSSVLPISKKLSSPLDHFLPYSSGHGIWLIDSLSSLKIRFPETQSMCLTIFSFPFPSASQEFQDDPVTFTQSLSYFHFLDD